MQQTMKTKPLSILPHDPSQETLLVASYLLHLVIFNLQKQWFSNLGEYENHQGDLMKIQMPRPCLPLMRLIFMFFISSPLKFEDHWPKSYILQIFYRGQQFAQKQWWSHWWSSKQWCQDSTQAYPIQSLLLHWNAMPGELEVMKGTFHIGPVFIIEEDSNNHMITDKEEKKPCPVKFSSKVLLSESQS